MFVLSGVLNKSVGSFTCNILRKASSTALHVLKPEMDEIIAESMLHKPTTAAKWYRRVDKSRNSITAQNEIANYCGGGERCVDIETSHGVTTEDTEQTGHKIDYNLNQEKPAPLTPLITTNSTNTSLPLLVKKRDLGHRWLQS